MKTKTIFKTLIIGLSFAMLGAVSCNVAKIGSTSAVFAQQEVDTSDWTATINLKEKIGTYGADWPNYQGYGQFNASNSEMIEASIHSSSFNSAMIDSNLEITKSNPADTDAGICRLNYDAGIRKAKVTWQLNDYSRYIKSVTYSVTATNQYNNVNLYLYPNRNASGDAVSSCALSSQNLTALNLDESVNAVSFVDIPDASFWLYNALCYGYTTLQYTVSYVTDPTQQAKFFSEAFLREMTCDGIGSITNDVWDTFNSRISTMSADALTVLKSAVANETSDSVIEQAMARYDLIANKYGKANFLNRETVHSANRLGSIISDQNNTLLIIALISSCVLVFCFIKIKTRLKR